MQKYWLIWFIFFTQCLYIIQLKYAITFSARHSLRKMQPKEEKAQKYLEAYINLYA